LKEQRLEKSLEIKNLYAGYGKGDIVRGISLSAEAGRIAAIIGPNGCGKTTLLKTIARLIPYRGTIALGGRDIAGFPRQEMARKIALMGQSETIYFPYSVYDTVSFGRFAYAQGFFKSVSQKDDEVICAVLEKLGLLEERGRMITELSGGQLQRVFLARTLAQDPDLILLDEPTNHLDLKHQLELLKFLSSWAKEQGKTVVAVLHDLNLARRFGDDIILMQDGNIVASWRPEEALDGSRLKEVYGVDIKSFMLESLEKWQA
jgi:iron complex transport system ATP-binding protein